MRPGGRLRGVIVAGEPPGGMDPVSDQRCQLILGPPQPDLRGGDDAVQEAISGPDLPAELGTREDHGIEFATEIAADCRERRGKSRFVHFADDHQVDVAVGGFGSGRDGTEEEHELVTASQGVQSGADPVPQSDGFPEQRTEFRIDRVIADNPEVDPVPVPSPRDQAGRLEALQGPLAGQQGAPGLTGDFALVE